MTAFVSRRSHLDLQVKLMAAEKNNNIIRMPETLRRDLPDVRNWPIQGQRPV